MKSSGRPSAVNTGWWIWAASAMPWAAATSCVDPNCFGGITSALISGTSPSLSFATSATGFMKIVRSVLRRLFCRAVAPLLWIFDPLWVTAIAFNCATASSRLLRDAAMVGPMMAAFSSRNAWTCRAVSMSCPCLLCIQPPAKRCGGR